MEEARPHAPAPSAEFTVILAGVIALSDALPKPIRRRFLKTMSERLARWAALAEATPLHGDDMGMRRAEACRLAEAWWRVALAAVERR